MKKKIFLVFLLVFLLSSVKVFASGFQLKTIGALDVDGVTAGHVWYSSGSPTITGITTAYTDVEVSVDGVAQPKVSASSDGTWIYHASMAEGDHTLVFTSIGSTITKTLTIGTVPENVGALTKATTPTAGNITPTLMLFSLAFLFLLPASYTFLKRRN